MDKITDTVELDCLRQSLLKDPKTKEEIEYNNEIKFKIAKKLWFTYLPTLWICQKRKS